MLVPCFMSWNKISQKCSKHTRSLVLSNVVHTFVHIPDIEHFSFDKIIHPTDRCGISKIWLNSISLHRCTLCWGKQKATLQCAVLSHNKMPQATDNVILEFGSTSNWPQLQTTCNHACPGLTHLCVGLLRFSLCTLCGKAGYFVFSIRTGVVLV